MPADFLLALRPPKLTRRFSIVLLVAAAMFMENLDSTVVVTALPQMALSFGVPPVDLSVGISAYILTIAVFIPASGWAADRFGPRTVFAAAIFIFTAASILCGFSPNLPFFVAMRVLQGLGGAMMVPVGRLVVLRSIEKQGLIRSMTALTWPALAAPMLGPPLGGFITTYASWHWIFFLNVPLGAIGLFLALRLIPPGMQEARRRFDIVGFGLTSGACFGLVFGLDLISRQDAAITPGLAWVVFGVLFGALAVRHARRHARPLVDMWALSLRTYATSVLGGSLFRISITSAPFLLPLMFQIGFGLSAFQSGLLLLAVFAGNMFMKLGTTQILGRFTYRNTLVVTGLVNVGALLGCALLTPATPLVITIPLLFVGGLARSMQFTAITTLAFVDIPQPRMSSANTLLNMATQLALGMGIALGAIALRVAHFIQPGDSSALPLVDFHIAFVIVAVVTLPGFISVLKLDAKAGDEVRLSQGRAPRS